MRMRSEVLVGAGLTLALILPLGVTAGSAYAQETRLTLTHDVVEDPAAAVFVYRDVESFIRALERLGHDPDTTTVLQEEYFDGASPGLLMFIEKYDLTMSRLLGALREHPEAYTSIPQKLAILRSEEPAFHEAYRDLAGVMHGAVFPPTYYVVAGHRGIGSGSVEGTLISIGKETPESIRTDLAATLVHEMVHMQQLAGLWEAYFAIFSGPGRTLLATSIREGAAMYFSELITGGSVHKNQARDFLLAHEARLWEAFRSEMLGGEMGEWLWSTPSDPEQPQDVGYAMGARIVHTFYERADDKAEAVRRILSITDYPAFLAASGYEGAGSRR
jgi:hypothetical protein